MSLPNDPNDVSPTSPRHEYEGRAYFDPYDTRRTEVEVQPIIDAINEDRDTPFWGCKHDTELGGVVAYIDLFADNLDEANAQLIDEAHLLADKHGVQYDFGKVQKVIVASISARDYFNLGLSLMQAQAEFYAAQVHAR